MCAVAVAKSRLLHRRGMQPTTTEAGSEYHGLGLDDDHRFLRADINTVAEDEDARRSLEEG